MSDTAHIVLRPEARREDFVALAAERGWAFSSEETRGWGRTGYRAYAPAPGAKVTWLEQHSLGVRLVSVTGAPALLEELGARLPRYTRDELLGAVRGEAVQPALDALRALALTERGPLAPDLGDALLRWMRHEHRFVRWAVLEVCAVGGWRELLPEVERRAASDGELGEVWARLAEGLRKKE